MQTREAPGANEKITKAYSRQQFQMKLPFAEKISFYWMQFPSHLLFFIMKNQKLWLTSIICVFLFSAGCDTQGAQQDFVEDANALPEGITVVLDASVGGEVCSEDQDDWRTAPVYNGVILVDRPPSPNPASGTLVTIVMKVIQFDRIRGGLVLRAFGPSNDLILLDSIVDASAPGEYVFQFSPSLLTENGLHRLFIFDTLGELISYGDLELVSELPTSCSAAS